MKDNKLPLFSELEYIFQDCNINFLVGSGLSTPFLQLLGNTENELKELSKEKNPDRHKKYEIYKDFFDKVISKNIEILRFGQKENTSPSQGMTSGEFTAMNDGSERSDPSEILDNYKTFLKKINTIILNRKNSILSKQINIFTTNFDIFLKNHWKI